MSGFSFCGIIGGALFVAIYGSVYNTKLTSELGSLNEYSPADAAQYAIVGPKAVSDSVALVCLACIGPAIASSLLGMCIKSFEVPKAKDKGAVVQQDEKGAEEEARKAKNAENGWAERQLQVKTTEMEEVPL